MSHTARRARRSQQPINPRMTHSGVNEELHEVGMDVEDLDVWSRADLDLVWDLPLLQHGVYTQSGLTLRMGESGECSVLFLCDSQDNILADLPFESLAQFLHKVNYRRNYCDGTQSPHRQKIVSITEGRGFARG